MGSGALKKKNAKAEDPPDISAAALRRRRVLFGHQDVQDFEKMDILAQYKATPTDDDVVFNRFGHGNAALDAANDVRLRMQKICNQDGYLGFNVLELLQIGMNSDQKVARRLYKLALVERPSKRQLQQHLRRSGTSMSLGDKEKVSKDKEKEKEKEEDAPYEPRGCELIGVYEFLALYSVIRHGDIDELLELLFCFFDFDGDDRVSVSDFEETIQTLLSLSGKDGSPMFKDAILKMALAGPELDEYVKLDESKQKTAAYRAAEFAVWKYGSAEGDAPPEIEEAGDLEDEPEPKPPPAPPPPPPPTETVEQPKAKAKPPPKKKKGGGCLCSGKQPDSDSETEIKDVKEEKDDEDDDEDEAKGSKDKKDTKPQYVKAQQCECGNAFMDDSMFCRKCGAKRQEVKVEKEEKKDKKDKTKTKSSKDQKDTKKQINAFGEDEDSEHSSDEEGKKTTKEDEDDKAQKTGCCGGGKKKAKPKKDADKKDTDQAETDKKNTDGKDAESDADEEVSKPKEEPKVSGKEQSKADPKEQKGTEAAKAKAKAKAKSSQSRSWFSCFRGKPKAASNKIPPPLTFEQWKSWFIDFVEVPEEAFEEHTTARPIGPGGFPPQKTLHPALLNQQQMSGYPPAANQQFALSQQYPTIDTRQGYTSNLASRGPSNFSPMQQMQQPLLEPGMR